VQARQRAETVHGRGVCNLLGETAPSTPRDIMARVPSQTWKTVSIAGLVILLLGMIFSGYIIWYVGILVLLLAMAGGALMFRQLGPPSR
jgi:hypothetical protein